MHNNNGNKIIQLSGDQTTITFVQSKRLVCDRILFPILILFYFIYSDWNLWQSCLVFEDFRDKQHIANFWSKLYIFYLKLARRLENSAENKSVFSLLLCLNVTFLLFLCLAIVSWSKEHSTRTECRSSINYSCSRRQVVQSNFQHAQCYMFAIIHHTSLEKEG